MNTPNPNHIVSLLETVQAKPVETYIYFPEVIRAGSTSIEKEDFDYLFAEGYLKETHSDKFGKHFTLSEAGARRLRHTE
jgi:hypothetical protein